MQASALTISATKTWIIVSINQRQLLIAKALRATSIGPHMVVNSILPVAIIYNTIFVYSVFIVESSPWPLEEMTNLDINQPKER